MPGVRDRPKNHHNGMNKLFCNTYVEYLKKLNTFASLKTECERTNH